MLNKKGITQLPVIIGLVVSLLVIIVLVTFSVNRTNENMKIDRINATQMSDLGFQLLIESINQIEELADEGFKTTDTIHEENGWYKLEVQKKINDDTMVVSITSVGGTGDEIVSQHKRFILHKSVKDTGVAWSAVKD